MIFKINKSQDYTVMSNYHLKDKRLSLKAKGLLSVMLSLPQGWDYSIAGLVSICAEGQTAIENALKELKQFGYLVVDKINPDKTDTGKYQYEYNIYEMPSKGSQTPVKDTFDYSYIHLSSETKKAEKSDIERLIGEYATDDEMRTLLNEWLLCRKSKRAATTIYAIGINLNKLSTYAKQSGMTDKEYLREVIKRGWAAFYPIKNYENSKKTPETASEKPKASYDVDKFKRDALNDDLVYVKKGHSEG